MSRKLCGGCLRLRDYSEFQKNHTRPSGIQSMCRECRSRSRRKRDTATLALFPGALDTFSGPGGRIVSGEPGTVTLPAAPLKQPDKKTQGKCHYRVRKAITMGVLSRPQRCSVCGRTREETGTLHAHHEDYTNPLTVIFLCRSCHEIVHNCLCNRFES